MKTNEGRAKGFAAAACTLLRSPEKCRELRARGLSFLGRSSVGSIGERIEREREQPPGAREFKG